jgi:lipid A ethanolaminephosphotransferase
MSAARGIRPAWLAAGASLWMAILGNSALWRELYANGLLVSASGNLLAVSIALVTAACLAGIISLLAWRPTFKPAISVLLVMSAAGAHFMMTYHVVIDPAMLTNVLQTDWHEASDLLTWRFFLVMLLLGLLPAAAVWRIPVRHQAWRSQALRNLGSAALMLVVCAAVVAGAFQPLSSSMRNDRKLRYMINPLNTLYALGKSGAAPLRGPGHLAALGTDARVDVVAGKPPLLVLVLGETGRSGNFGINGYQRPTTPELQQAGVASARHVMSCGTSTAASVPCMFSYLGRAGFDARQQDYENLLDVLQHAGLAVLWVDNQSGCKGVCDRVPHVDISGQSGSRFCSRGGCWDGVMLEGLQERLDALPPERVSRGTVVVLHQMGSHGPAYHLRSPPAFKRFLPECTSANLPDCPQGELINAYDNSIAYTDHFLASTIKWLRQRDDRFSTAMLYVADHGESLGEHNLYLHGMPYGIAPDVQKHVPWITWLSAGFETHTGISLDCVRSREQVPLSHDHYFHSVLGLMQVHTSIYNRRLDAYAPCAGH